MAASDFRIEWYSGRRVAVLGAAGFIGRWVARAQSALGAELFLIVRRRAPAEDIFHRYQIQGRVIELDLLDEDQTVRTLKSIRPAITFNLAGYGVDRSENDEALAYRLNDHLLELICKSVSETADTPGSRPRLIHVGSAQEYGSSRGNLAESSRPNPTTLYGRSKLAGTLRLAQLCRAYGLMGLTARLFTVYGPGEQAGRLLPSLLSSARDGSTLQLTAGAQRRDFTYVEDVAEGLLRLGSGTARAGEIVNLATGRLTPVRDFVEAAARILPLAPDQLRFGQLPRRAEEMRHDNVTIDRLRQIADWTPTTGIVEGIRKTWRFEATGD